MAEDNQAGSKSEEQLGLEAQIASFLDSQETGNDLADDYDVELLRTLDAYDEEGIFAIFMTLQQATRRTLKLWTFICTGLEGEDNSAVQAALLQGFMKGYRYRDEGGELE